MSDDKIKPFFDVLKKYGIGGGFKNATNYLSRGIVIWLPEHLDMPTMVWDTFPAAMKLALSKTLPSIPQDQPIIDDATERVTLTSFTLHVALNSAIISICNDTSLITKFESEFATAAIEKAIESTDKHLTAIQKYYSSDVIQRAKVRLSEISERLKTNQLNILTYFSEVYQVVSHMNEFKPDVSQTKTFP